MTRLLNPDSCHTKAVTRVVNTDALRATSATPLLDSTTHFGRYLWCDFFIPGPGCTMSVTSLLSRNARGTRYVDNSKRLGQIGMRTEGQTVRRTDTCSYMFQNWVPNIHCRKSGWTRLEHKNLAYLYQHIHKHYMIWPQDFFWDGHRPLDDAARHPACTYSFGISSHVLKGIPLASLLNDAF